MRGALGELNTRKELHNKIARWKYTII